MHHGRYGCTIIAAIISRYSKVTHGSSSPHSPLTAICIIEGDENDIVVLAFAVTDRLCRQHAITFIDIDTQLSLWTIESSHHSHNREITQLLYMHRTFVTVSSDCVISWTYINKFDVNHRFSNRIECVKQERHFRPGIQGLIDKVCLSDDFALVMLKNTSVIALNLSTMIPVSTVPLPANAVPRHISVYRDLLCVSTVVERGTSADIFDLRDSPLTRIGSFRTSKRMYFDLFDQDTILALSDEGSVEVVDIASNRVVGSTSVISGRVSVSNFSFARDKFVCMGNKSCDFDILPTACMLSDGGAAPFFETLSEEPRKVSDQVWLPSTQEFTPQNRVERYTAILCLPINERCWKLINSDPRLPNEKRFWNQFLSEQYSATSRGSIKRLVATLSLLTTWEPSLRGYPETLLRQVYPFVKLFGNRAQFCFELVMFLITNFWIDWLTSGIPQVDITAFLEERDPYLLGHLEKISNTQLGPLVYKHMCANILTEILSGAEWIRLMDLLVMWFQGNRQRGIVDTIFLKVVLSFLVREHRDLIQISSGEELIAWLKTRQDHHSGFVEDVWKSAIKESRIDKIRRPFYLAENMQRYPDFPHN